MIEVTLSFLLILALIALIVGMIIGISLSRPSLRWLVFNKRATRGHQINLRPMTH